MLNQPIDTKEAKINEVFSIGVPNFTNAGYQSRILYDIEEFELMESENVINEDDDEPLIELVVGSINEDTYFFKALKSGTFEIRVEWQRRFDETEKPMEQIITVVVE